MSRSLCATLRVAVVLSSMCAAGATVAQAPAGTLDRIRVNGPSLEGNLSGDDATREVFVYLPPSYASERNRRYPVVYFLHGYGVGAQTYVNLLGLPGAADQAIAAGAREMIVVLPDGNSKFSGSLYSNSPTIGDWETFLAGDLVAYVDRNYRTVAERDSRGLAGHSMGGYGTLRVGMKRADAFGALFAMSSCCLLNQAPSLEAVQQQIERTANGFPPPNEAAAAGPRGGPPGAGARGAGGGRGAQPGAGPGRGAPQGAAPAGPRGGARGGARGGGGFANVLLAQAAAWAPNPANPPLYLDWPYKDGELQPLVQAKWAANSPLVFVDQYVPELKSYRAIYLDVGNADGLMATNVQLDEAMNRLGVAHEFEVYEGDHGNRVAQRFRENVLPFFSKHLE